MDDFVQVVSCVLSLLELVVRNVPGGTQRILELNAETIENLQVHRRNMYI